MRLYSTVTLGASVPSLPVCDVRQNIFVFSLLMPAQGNLLVVSAKFVSASLAGGELHYRAYNKTMGSGLIKRRQKAEGG
jgi:hypothetical protein